MTSLTSFPRFKALPLEMRLRVWCLAANNQPRTIDIWTDFVRCNINDITFYCQKYFCELSDITPPAILHTSREARQEALKHYVLEYETSMCGLIIEPRMYINYATDILVPRGYWNMVSFEHFVSRAFKNRLVTLAIDINGTFWTENLKDYVVWNHWLINGIEELYIYQASGEGMWKGSEYLEKFRKRNTGLRRDLEFQSLDEPGKDLTDFKGFLDGYFNVIEGAAEEEVKPESEDRRPRYLDHLEPTPADELIRPRMMFMKLLDKNPNVLQSSNSSVDTLVPTAEDS